MTQNLAEQQFRQWSGGLSSVNDLESESSPELLEQSIKPFITISRETGAGAPTIIQQLNQTLRIGVVDRQILEYLAERYKLPRDMLERVDEKVCNWLVEAVGIWLSKRLISQTDYIALLARFVFMAARDASAIFVGRGIQFILPPEKGLAVRIIAPFEQRVARIMEEQQLKSREAGRYATARDNEQRNFVRHHYHQDIADSHLYDLVINTQDIALEDAANVINRLWSQRFLEKTSA